MSVPIFLVGMGQTDYDDTTKYKKVGAVAAAAGQHISAVRRLAEKFRSPFGAKDVFGTHVVNEAYSDAEKKIIKYALAKYPDAVAIVDAKVKYDIEKSRVNVMIHGTVVVPRESKNSSNNKNTRKNRSSRRSTRKNRS
jgi:hypothetical protein